MSVKTYHPAFKVLVTKNVQRSANPGVPLGGVWDITPYLGDHCTISVRKSLYQPCGSAIISIPDAPFFPEPGGQPPDSLYGLVEPTDGIEIYLARSPEKYGWGESGVGVGPCPVLMRGFVRDVHRTEKMGTDGKPIRQTVLAAQDYGAVFDMLRVWNLKTSILGTPSVYDAWAKYGFNYQPIPTADFYGVLVDEGNKWLDAVWNKGGWTWRIERDFRVTQGVHAMMGVNNQEGAMWHLMAREQDSPWNELFFEDRRDGPTLVYRPTPFRKYRPSGDRLTWEYLDQFGQAISAEQERVTSDDIVSLDVKRSDHQVQNIFWLENPTAQQALVMPHIMAESKGGRWQDRIFDTGYEFNDPQVYGERLLHGTFRQWPNGTEQHPVGALKEHWRRNSYVHFPEFWEGRLDWMREANRDNSILEDGVATVKGDEKLRVGKYLTISRGDLEWEAYMTGVTHTFAPYKAYTTTVDLSRGTGYWTRILSQWPPYLRERKKGVYTK